MRVVNFLTMCHHSLGHEKKPLLRLKKLGLTQNFIVTLSTVNLNLKRTILITKYKISLVSFGLKWCDFVVFSRKVLLYSEKKLSCLEVYD